ncbi:hypothetical protein BpHYR1_036096 [Brachionus plicatilis]|uniref:Uncharacterized protein n=1 Tax=Brachionus plicatilis TaxID=10195 RepID=A0A3M7R2G4_BRAPC|nr:hypothetical protein BpHYR1_036096 [Brachionus plicatilis]
MNYFYLTNSFLIRRFFLAIKPVNSAVKILDRLKNRSKISGRSFSRSAWWPEFWTASEIQKCTWNCKLDIGRPIGLNLKKN